MRFREWRGDIERGKPGVDVVGALERRERGGTHRFIGIAEQLDRAAERARRDQRKSQRGRADSAGRRSRARRARQRRRRRRVRGRRDVPSRGARSRRARRTDRDRRPALCGRGGQRGLARAGSRSASSSAPSWCARTDERVRRDRAPARGVDRRARASHDPTRRSPAAWTCNARAGRCGGLGEARAARRRRMAAFVELRFAIPSIKRSTIRRVGIERPACRASAVSARRTVASRSVA